MDCVRNSYNAISDQWDELRSQTPVNPCIVDFAKRLPPNCRVLDVGCGTGYPISAYLAEQGFHVTGIDISENMIEKAKRLHLPHAKFYVHDVLNFHPSEPYDAVIAFDSIWHIPHDQQANIYKVVSSLLNRGGYFLFTHGACDGETTGTMFGQSFYYSSLDTQTVQRLLAQQGFSILSFIENYQEKNGARDLLVVACKDAASPCG